MGRTRKTDPSYLLHRQSGRARVVVYDHEGKRKQYLLPGLYNSPESQVAYKRICVKIRNGQGKLPPSPQIEEDLAELTITELTLRFMKHAETYYLQPTKGRASSESLSCGEAFRPLNRLFGAELAKDFGPLMLRELREAYTAGNWLTNDEIEQRNRRGCPIGLARTTANKHVSRVRRLFRWAVSEKLVSENILIRISTLPPLKEGRSNARETESVKPVDIDLVEATLPLLPTCPADILRVLLLTGARIGELCTMTGQDLDQSGPIWIYRPSSHKNKHRGQVREITIGPKAQLVLRKYLKADQNALLFIPAEQDEIRKADMRAKRKSKVQPSQLSRTQPDAKRKPGDCYSHNVINRAIARVCERAGLESWSCHQLRHTAALVILREFGLEAARSTLGHKQIDMTLHYAGIDLERAKEVATKIG